MITTNDLPPIDQCLRLYICLIDNPDHERIKEYASRFQKLSIADQGELVFRITQYYNKKAPE